MWWMLHFLKFVVSLDSNQKVFSKFHWEKDAFVIIHYSTNGFMGKALQKMCIYIKFWHVFVRQEAFTTLTNTFKQNVSSFFILMLKNVSYSHKPVFPILLGMTDHYSFNYKRKQRPWTSFKSQNTSLEFLSKDFCLGQRCAILHIIYPPSFSLLSFLFLYNHAVMFWLAKSPPFLPRLAHSQS